MSTQHTPGPRPYIHHAVCPQSGMHDLWLLCGDKVLAGPAPLPAGWVALYNRAKIDAQEADDCAAIARAATD